MAPATTRGRKSQAVTPRQLQILTCVRDARKRCGFSPTLQEIADGIGLSKVTVFEHVDVLVRKRLLTRRSHSPRSLQLTALAEFPDERSTLVPLVGRIAAGSPIEAIESPEVIDLETLFESPHPVRALTVVGDSMIDDQIRDGDIVIFEQRSQARDGELVIALIDGQEATLKRIYREPGRVRLQPANAEYDPIYIRDKDRSLEIQGVVIGVMRRY